MPLKVNKSVSVADLNDIDTNVAFVVPSTRYFPNLGNRPPIDGYFVFISIIRESSRDYAQMAIDYVNGNIYTRSRNDDWVQI